MASGARNSSKFLGDIQKFSDTVGIKFNDAVRAIAFAILGGVIERTPVDTGRARAGWQLTVNEPGEYVPPKGSTQAASVPELSNMGLVGKIFIVNNVEYIVYLEEGSSQQAPAGMVRVTLAQIQTEISAIIRANA